MFWFWWWWVIFLARAIWRYFLYNHKINKFNNTLKKTFLYYKHLIVCGCSVDGWNHIMSPKNYNHKNRNFAFDFFGYMWTSHFGFFCSFQVYCINFKLKLAYLKIKSKKYLQIWTYEIYLCQKNTCHKVWKIANILQN